MAGYLALAGMGSGSYIIAAITDLLRRERYGILVKPGFYITIPTIILGSVFLILDLGRPERFMNVFNNPDTSILSLGAYLLAIFASITIITLATRTLLPKAGKIISIVEAIGSVFAFAVAIYIGLLLGAAIARPFWFTPVLPWLLFVSSLTMGLAAAVLLLLSDRRVAVPAESIRSLHKISAALIIVEVMALAAFFATAPDALGVSQVLLGSLSPAFYGGVALIGIVLPLGVESRAVHLSEANWSLARRLLILGLAMLIIGGVVLRFVILWAGQLA